MFHKSILFSIYLALLSICTSEGAPTCSSEEFTCKNDKCIPATSKCDKVDDCGDNSDEENCEAATCRSYESSCENGKCIPTWWRCDGQDDCGDRSDEENCTKATSCRSDQFSCTNGKCIPTTWLCDKEDDCGDSSDEENCTASTCSSEEFTCKNDKCIPATSKCDKEDDCGDNSDEENCDVCPPGMFACTNGRCLPSPWRCDGEADCEDKSDEENCTAIHGVCDKDTEFKCGNKTCIPIGLVCNKENDCGQSEDEPTDKCFVNECLLNNGGCPQLCVDDNLGFHCECHDGYQLNSNGSCIDIDECQVPGICSQLCKNSEGGFNCSCLEGYIVDPFNDTRCNSEMGHGSLLFKNGSDLLMLDIETREKTTVVIGIGKVVALDYDFGNDEVVWSDSVNKSIYRLRLQNGTSGPLSANGSNVDTLVKLNIMAEGIAIDWIHGNVYWTGGNEKSINVVTMKGKLRENRVLFENNISKSRAIVVNPLEGWLFWTDWGNPAKIERAGMDGTQRSVIISENIYFPNGLAIDYETRRLFWTDAKQRSLSSCNYDGSNVNLVLMSRPQVGHPFAIDVFEDWLYWNDWISKSIRRVNKFTGDNWEIVAGEIDFPTGLKVYHPYKKPEGINYCLNANGCSHFCLPAPQVTVQSAKFTCFCPVGMILADDKRICHRVE